MHVSFALEGRIGRRMRVIEDRAEVTRLVDPPLDVGVELDAEGIPIRLHRPVVGGLEAVAHWRVDTDWWRKPVLREYWRVIVDGSFVCEVFHDPGSDTWFLDRIYD
jgi:hypothetical protein